MSDTYLTINGLRLDAAGFCTAMDITDLLHGGPRRGSDFTSQGVDGDTFRAKPRGALVALIPLEVEGQKNSGGTVHATKGWAGIRDNLATIEASCVTASGSSMVPVTVTFADAGTLGGSCYCPQLDVGLYQEDRTGGVVVATLRVVVPSGALS